MKGKRIIISFAPLVLLFFACNNNIVSRAEYNAVAAYADSLKGQNDSLQLELSDLMMYVDFLTEENSMLIDELKRTPCDQK